MPQPKPKAGLLDSVVSLFLGNLVLPDERDSPTYNFRQRQNRLISSSALLPVAFRVGVVALIAFQSLPLGIVAAFWMVDAKLHNLAASTSDAVFDSLWERINLQSAWLDFRLNDLESKITRTAPEAQVRWLDSQAYDGQLSDSWHSYPEKARAQKNT